MSLPNPTFAGQKATVADKTYEAVSVNPPVWKAITTGTTKKLLSDYLTSNTVKYINSEHYPSTLDIQQYLSNEMVDATKVVLIGTFTATKAVGFDEATYGTDGRSLGGLTLNSGQPCLFIPKSRKNIIFDASQATFIVDKHGQGGLDVWGSRNTILHGGHWIAPANPDATVRFPPIDGNSGFAEKGTSTYGFNTTTLSPDIGGVRNNQVDTRGQSSGGYAGAFPTDTGGTSSTWGTWLGGYIGNYGSAITICGGFGHTVYDFEAEGFNGYGIEVGMIRLPDGTALNRIDPLAAPVTPKKTKILGGYVHDCYTGGVQRNRYIKCDIMHLNVERVGHPNASLANTINSVSPQVDPGYGISSGRFSPQFKSTTAFCNFEDCNRKGIDAHMGTGEKYICNDVKAMTWGVQIAVDESLQDTERGNGFYDRKYNLVLRDNTIYAGYRAIDAANGAFGRDPRETANLWWSNFHALIDGNTCFAPNGWYYNYGHSPFTVTNNTFTYSAPYGYANTGVGFGFTHGAFANRGPVDGDVIKNNKVFNGPDGNYNYSYYFYQMSNAAIKDNFADITPYTHDAVNINAPYKANNPSMNRGGLASIGFVASGNQITDCDVSNNKSINHITSTVLVWNPAPSVAEAAQSVEYSMQFHGAGTIADTGKNKSDTGAENAYIVRQDNQLPDALTTFGKEAGGGYWTGLVTNAQWIMSQISMNDVDEELSTLEMWFKVSVRHSTGSTYAFRAGAPYEEDTTELGALVLSNSGAGFILNASGGGTRYIDGLPYVAGTTLNLDTWYKLTVVRAFKCSWLALGANNTGGQGMSGSIGKTKIIKKYAMSASEVLDSFNADKALYGK